MSFRTLTASIALMLATTAHASEVRWRTDFEAARLESDRTGKPLLVVFYRVGEKASEAMLRPVYRHRRFAKATNHVIPVLACYFEERDGDTACATFGALSARQLANGRDAAHAHLFGAGTAIPLPQHLVLAPKEGGVLWHGIHRCSLSSLLRGLSEAKRNLHKRPSAGLSRVKKHAKRLAHRADTSRTALLELRTLVTHAPDAQFPHLIATIERFTKTCRHVLECIARHLPPKRAEQRIRVALDIVGKDLGHGLLALVGKRNAGGRAGATSAGPVARLGKVEGLADAGLPVSLRRALTANGELRVFWFFRPGDPTLERQKTALEGSVRELAGRVRFYGLGCSLDPKRDARACAKSGLPFPCTAYSYDGENPLAGVRWFPAAVVLDRDGTVVYRSTQDGEAMKSYTGFLSVLRKLLD